MKDYHLHLRKKLRSLIDGKPLARADIREASLCGCINGTAIFYKDRDDRGVLVACILFGLPSNSFYQLYISGTENPRQNSRVSPCSTLRQSIPLSQLRGNDGYAFSVIYTEAITESNIVGRSVYLTGFSEAVRSDRIAFGLIMPVN